MMYGFSLLTRRALLHLLKLNIRSCTILACQISLADIIGRAGGELAYAVQLRGTISGILIGEIKLILAEKLHAHKLGVVRC